MEFKEITTKFNKQNFKKYLPFIIGGAGLGLVVLLTRKRTSAPAQVTYQEPQEEFPNLSDASFPTDYGFDSSAEYTAQFMDIDNRLDDLNQSILDIQTQSTELTGRVSSVEQADRNETFVYVPEPRETPTYRETRPSASVMQNSVSSTKDYGNDGVGYSKSKSDSFLNSISQSPTDFAQEQARVEKVYFDRVSEGKSVEKQEKYFKELKAVEPKGIDLGNSGIGYNKSVSDKFEANLKTNDSAYNKEIARVNKVISDRTNLGLDITAQTNYLNKIKR